MTKISNILNNLFLMARDHDSQHSAKLVSALYDRNKPIVYGFNSASKTHTFQKKFGKNNKSICWHSETNCIYNAVKNNIDPYGKTLYIARARNMRISHEKFEWCFGNAYPCEGCMRCLMKYGVKKVVYSLDTLPEHAKIASIEYGITELN